jgi:hypothetical protein
MRDILGRAPSGPAAAACAPAAPCCLLAGAQPAPSAPGWCRAAGSAQAGRWCARGPQQLRDVACWEKLPGGSCRLVQARAGAPSPIAGTRIKPQQRAPPAHPSRQHTRHENEARHPSRLGLGRLRAATKLPTAHQRRWSQITESTWSAAAAAERGRGARAPRWPPGSAAPWRCPYPMTPPTSWRSRRWAPARRSGGRALFSSTSAPLRSLTPRPACCPRRRADCPVKRAAWPRCAA